MEEISKSSNQLKLSISAEDITRAFASSQFSLVYQPRVSFAEPHSLLGVEAFVRLDHPKRGTLSPDKFLPLITRLNLMLELTLVVLKQAASQWTSLNKSGYPLQISINLDYQLLDNRSLAKTLADTLGQTEMPKRFLTLEISNSQGLAFTSQACEQMTRLRMKGFRVALDDCGQVDIDKQKILELPVDILKLHRSIVCQLRDSSSARQRAKQVQNIADRIGVPMVAVGVESLFQADWLKRNGCESAQGYLYGPPLSGEGFGLFLMDVNQWRTPDEPEKIQVLIVNHNLGFAAQLSEGLELNYSVTAAQIAEDAKQLFSEYLPEIVVLENFPNEGLNLDLCKTLYGLNKEPPSILFMGEDDQDLLIDAYSAGASDFFHKTVSIDEMRAKIKSIASFQLKRKKIHTETQELENAAMGAMQEAAHYGDVVQFLKKLLHCNDELAMAKQIFQFMAVKNLACAVQFRGTDTLFSFDDDGTFCSPLEQNMFEMLQNKGRLYEFNNRLMVNDQHVSILIKNMPSESDEKGRVRDYIAVVIEGLETRYQDLMRKQALYSVFEQLNQMAGSLSEEIAAEELQKKQMVEKLNLDMQMSFHRLDLSEEQEQHITNMIEPLINGYDESEESAQATCARITGLVDLLSKTINSVDESSNGREGDEPSAAVELF